MNDELVKLANFLKENGAEEDAKALMNMLTETDVPAEEPVVAEIANTAVTLEAVLDKLSGVADKLDGIGLNKEADLVDNFIKKTAEDVMKWKEEDKSTEQSKRYDSDFHHSQQIREPKREQERVDREGVKNHHVHTYQQTNVTALNTRHCPEHIGVSLGRVGELTYQCALDGKIYNWEAGWEDYDGNKHPGGSVAGQTPGSTDYAIPHRLFDTRENIMNLKG